jgi:catechol 2,3-dioxygenase-like lactoylglutathione lyase family enzyme
MSSASTSGLNHVTLKCTPGALAPLRDFYVASLALVEGARPDFPFPGHWLYGSGRPIVHLAGLLDDPAARSTGPLDHISFTGLDLAATRRRLQAQAIPFDEAPVPGWPLHQIFFLDPGGLKIELTFDVPEAA